MTTGSPADVRLHRLRVAEVITETRDARSLVFRLAPEQRRFFRYRPGQFLTLRIPDVDGPTARCYSLASSPDTDPHLKVTVKRVAGGVASNWVCDHATVGTELDALEPAGVFTPRSLHDDHLLFAGGSGITPIMSILKSLLATGTGRASLFYANQDENSVIFADELDQLRERYPSRFSLVHWLESARGLPTEQAVRGCAGTRDFPHALICGPRPFMNLARSALRDLGLPRAQVRLERFSSLGGNPFDAAVPATADSGRAPAHAAEVEVGMNGARHTFAWPREQRLLDLLRANGLDAPASCSEGICASCECRVLEGEVQMVNNQVLEADDLAAGLVLACQALPVTDRVRVRYE